MPLATSGSEAIQVRTFLGFAHAHSLKYNFLAKVTIEVLIIFLFINLVLMEARVANPKMVRMLNGFQVSILIVKHQDLHFFVELRNKGLCSGRRKRLKLSFSGPFLCFISFGRAKANEEESY